MKTILHKSFERCGRKAKRIISNTKIYEETNFYALISVRNQQYHKKEQKKYY